LFQKDHAVSPGDQIRPVGRVATRIEQPNYGTIADMR
jgi:hypothetical protein